MVEVHHIDYLWALNRAAELVHDLGVEVQKGDVEAAQELSAVVITLKTLHAQIEQSLHHPKNRKTH